MIKHKKWIGRIFRSKIKPESRYGKICLDKNERIKTLERSFFKKLISNISSTKITSYPEIWNLYNAVADLHKLKTDQIVITAGADGATGVAGATGPMGLTGLTGADGATGPAGVGIDEFG